MQNKKDLVKELAEYQKALNVQQLYDSPSHKTVKNWLSEVASILKNLDESDYQEFNKLKTDIHPGSIYGLRKNAAHDIDMFVRQKTAEYKRYNFSAIGVKKKKRKEICIPIPELKIPEWVKKHSVLVYTSVIATVIAGLVLYYLFGIGVQ